MKLPNIQRGMVKTALGSIFYLMSDGRSSTSTTVVDKAPILCFHMSPRSSDEYLEVLPLLAAGTANCDDNDDDDDVIRDGRVVIAFDLPGYGASENPPRSCTVDEISDACLKAADSVLATIDDDDDDDDATTAATGQYVAVGSLLGNYVCLSLASRRPERIRAGILTNPWFSPGATGMIMAPANSINNEQQQQRQPQPIPDSFELKDDGSHLAELHSKRSGWLDDELNFRAVQSEMAYLGNRRRRYAKGINIEGGSDYDFASAVRAIARGREKNGSNGIGGNNSPTFLCIRGEACATLFDNYGLDGTKRFDEACEMLIGRDESGRVETLRGDKSTLNIVNQMPEEFAAACNQFLSGL